MVQIHESCCPKQAPSVLSRATPPPRGFCLTSWRGKTTPAATRPQPFRGKGRLAASRESLQNSANS